MISLGNIVFRLHPLFVIVMLASILTGFFVELLTLFGIVFIHELGHIAAAKGFGWRIKEVRLLPFGGVAEVEEQGSVSAWEELIVAVAGPLQNAVMIALAWGMQSIGIWDDDWIQYFIQANLMIALFNLLPIMPLDGGKILQSMLSFWMSYRGTILFCTWSSLVVSILIIIASFIPLHQDAGIQLNVLMIGLFLLYANWYQRKHLPFHFIRFLMNRELRMKRLLDKGVMAQPIVVRFHQQLGDIVHMFMREKLHVIYVVNETGELQIIIQEKDLLRKYFTDRKPRSAVSELFM